jgi:hypothetical protein
MPGSGLPIKRYTATKYGGDAYIIKPSILSSADIKGPISGSISSSAAIKRNYSGEMYSGLNIGSDARINKATIISNAQIIKHNISTDVNKIYSAANILHHDSINFTLPSIVIGQSSGAISFYLPAIIVRAAEYEGTNQNSVYDIITSSLMDLTEVQTPDPYYSYDWAYDWVSREWNNCVVRFETRQSDDSNMIRNEEWKEITNGQVIPYTYVKRYHQWRMHLWATGSGDFELHQFTIKAYTQYPSNKFNTSIIT